jgi:signal transduction histidine kinase
MFIPASSNLIALCRSQVALLTRVLGAGLSAVYLAEELAEGKTAKLVPIVVYPETATMWAQDQVEAMLPAQTGRSGNPRLLSPGLPRIAQETQVYQEEGTEDRSSEWEDRFLWRQRQIVLPLMHEGMMMGFLVTAREDRPWNEQELANIEEISTTLAIACFLDQQRAWVEQQLVQQRFLEEQQRDVLDDLLHQFRNPLTALRTFGKLLLRRFQPNDQNHRVANSIVRESDRLQELLLQMDDTIDRSWMVGSGGLPNQCLLPESNSPSVYFLLPSAIPSLEACAIAEVLEPLIDSAKAIAQERNIDLITDIPANLPPVKANASALREVLNNLIDNALKYTPAGGQVLVQAGREKPSLTGVYQGVAVSDTGCGIPQEDLAHLFERHYRGVQATTNIPGTGLGLAIAKELVDKMQGEITAFSPAELPLSCGDAEHQGVGTTLIVWLPVELELRKSIDIGKEQ